MLLVELSFGTQISEELSTGDISHEEEEEAGVLCETLQTDLDDKEAKGARLIS